MAEKKSNLVSNKPMPDAPQGKSKLIIFLIIFFILLLGCAGFAAGVYLKVIDVSSLALKYKLYDYPLIGTYFPQPVTNFETVNLPQAAVPAAQTPANPAPPIAATKPVVPALNANLPLSDLDKEKLLKSAKQEEAKRISRLARLYSEMKPDEAVSILNQLDDNTVIAILGKMEDDQVAKIMAVMSPQRAANLSQQMLKGQKN